MLSIFIIPHKYIIKIHINYMVNLIIFLWHYKYLHIFCII